MKKLLIIMLVLAITPFAYAEGDWASRVEVGLSSPICSGNVQEGQYVEVRLQRKNLFLAGGYETNNITFAGQSGIDLEMYSLGLGYEHPLNENFSVSVQAGYYMPINDGEVYTWPSTQAEGLHREFNERLSISGNGIWRSYTWDRYEVEYGGNIGGKIALNFHKQWKYSQLGLSGGVRFLNLDESRTGKNNSFYTQGKSDPCKDGWWVTHDKQSFTAYQIGITYGVKFNLFRAIFGIKKI